MLLTSFSDVGLWIVIAVVLALAGLKFSHRILPVHEVPQNMEFISSTTGTIGTLLSIVLGLVISSAADQYKSLEDSVDSEASSIAEIFRLSRALPEARTQELQNLCIEYCDQVINTEWPLMRKGELSDDVTQTYLKLNDAILKIDAGTNKASNIQAELLGSLGEAGNDRRARFVAVTSLWIRQLVPMLALCSFVTMLTTFLYVQNKPSKLQYLLVTCAAIVLGANFGVLNMISRPFSSNGGITPKQFEVNRDDMKKFMSGQPLF